MPYTVKHDSKGWYVWNEDKKRNYGHSKSKEMAESQMRFLYGVEHGMIANKKK